MPYTLCQVLALPDASSTAVSPAAAAYGAVWAVAQTAATAVTLPLAIGLVVLLGWVAYLVVNNKTTIEYHEVRAGRHDFSAYNCELKIWGKYG